MTVKQSRDVAAVAVPNGVKTSKQVLISAEEAPNFALRRFIMEAGGGMPRHTNTVEHEQYVLAGKARIGIGAEEFMVKAGDVVFIPGNVPHWYQNIGDGNFEFLCIVPNQADVTTILTDDLSC